MEPTTVLLLTFWAVSMIAAFALGSLFANWQRQREMSWANRERQARRLHEVEMAKFAATPPQVAAQPRIREPSRLPPPVLREPRPPPARVVAPVGSHMSFEMPGDDDAELDSEDSDPDHDHMKQQYDDNVVIESLPADMVL